MELGITIILGFMIIGAIYAIHARDLLSAVIAMGIVGYGLVICFLLLKAPDLINFPRRMIRKAARSGMATNRGSIASIF